VFLIDHKIYVANRDIRYKDESSIGNCRDSLAASQLRSELFTKEKPPGMFAFQAVSEFVF